MKQGLTYDNILLRPRYSSIIHRDSEVDLTSYVTRHHKLRIPIIAANMDTICEHDMAVAMAKYGALGIVHRFLDIQNQVNNLTSTQAVMPGRLVGAAIGAIDDWRERLEALVMQEVNIICLDVAHADHVLVHRVLRTILKDYGYGRRWDLIVGNIATKEAAQRLKDEFLGVIDAVKVGVGPGCKKRGSRILMSNGFYRNIEDIKPGDRIINKNGQPISVIKAFCTGRRKVCGVRHNKFHKDDMVTPDHQYWSGDLSTCSPDTIRTNGYTKLLDRPNRNGELKYKWLPIGDEIRKTLLLPRYITFEFPESFNIHLKNRNHGRDLHLKPCYNLGYIFGFFLGDGTSSCPVYKGNRRGFVRFSVGANQEKITDKLMTVLTAAGREGIKGLISPTLRRNKNINIVTVGHKPFAEFLSTFGKHTNKHLPEYLLVDNKEYLQGLYDGLLDSDGHYDNDGRNTFTNTSGQLIELFGVIHYILHGHFPEYRQHGINSSNKVSGVNMAYRCRTYLSGERRLTQDYEIVKILNIEKDIEIAEVWDLEVDCDTHSFIADNAIVHNSLCSTRLITGHGVPQVSAILEVVQVFQNTEVRVIADGGFRHSGDMVKALALGADVVMTGSLLAGCDETPGPVTMVRDRLYKAYRGMASYDAMVANGREGRTPEGFTALVPKKGPVKEVLDQLVGGLKSGLSYSGARTIGELHRDAEWMQITPAALLEGHPHLFQWMKE